MKHIEFQDKKGTFIIHNPENYSGLYLPLAGEKGLKSSITPNLGGDSKTDQNHFLLEPVSIENLHNNRNTRNFWCRVYKASDEKNELSRGINPQLLGCCLSAEIQQNRNLKNLQRNRKKACWKPVLCGRSFPADQKNMAFRLR